MTGLSDTYFTVGFIRDLVELKLWYVWHLVKVQESSLADALAWTSFSGKCASPEDGDGPHGAGEWDRLRGALEELLEAHGPCSDPFQESGMDLLWPHIEPGIAERTAVLDRRWEQGVVGCIRYEYPAVKGKADPGDSVIIHFRNTMRPESPFSHRRLLIESLQEIIARTGQTHPHVSQVQMGSWLNSFPPFLSLFPEAWDASGLMGGPGGHMGWWGQFMDRTGGLHARHARMFKTRGAFPFRARSCRCSIELLEGHLQCILGA
jgi:hypothetical protein